MSITNSLDSIYFIKVPEGTSFSKAAFKIDPNIELPVQKKEKDETEMEKLMTISVLTGQNRQVQSEADGRFPIYRTESVIYAAVLEEAAAQYGMTPEKLVEKFHLIHQDWKTGET